MGDAIRGRRVLVVEDEWLLADDMRDALESAGAEVLGPVPDIAGALAVLAAEARIDAALLDVNLGGALAYSVADALIGRGIPIAFATGYDGWALPDRFAATARVEKPVSAQAVVAVLGPLLA